MMYIIIVQFLEYKYSKICLPILCIIHCLLIILLFAFSDQYYKYLFGCCMKYNVEYICLCCNLCCMLNLSKDGISYSVDSTAKNTATFDGQKITFDDEWIYFTFEESENKNKSELKYFLF